MAFQTNRSSSFNSNKPAVQGSAVAKKSDTINLSGLYEGKADSKLVLKGGKLKEAITIPAGYTLKVFKKGGISKNGKELPPFEIVAQPPRTV